MAGLAGAAALLILAALGAARVGPAVAAALLVALVGLVLARTVRRDAEPAASLPGPAPGEAGPPPYGVMINALPDPVLVVSASERDDLTGRRMIFANAAARSLLRIPPAEGLLVKVVRAPEVLEAVDRALFEARDAEALFETAGVQPRVFRVFARPVGLAVEGPRLALLVFREETELRRVERMRADFLANASHELRTPLASLSGFIETLRGHARADEAARDRFLGIMQVQAERMARLIDDLMSLSRIELNEHILPDDEVDLVSAALDVVDAIGPIAEERQVRILTNLPPAGSAVVVGDRHQLVQVFQNLVDNALKYSPAGGEIRISLVGGQGAEAATGAAAPRGARFSLLTPDRAQGQFAVFQVSDQGPGIQREHLPRLSERFYRVEGQKSGERSGTGLGLAIVKHIVNRHRGGLAVESRPGEGTTFTAYFPLKEVAAQPATASVAKAS